MFKKTLSLILVLVMICACSMPAFAAQTAKYELKSFSDVKSTDWFYSAVMKAAKLGLVSGTVSPDANGVGEYAPNDTFTRAQMIVVTVRAVADEHLKNSNSNIAGSKWYYGDVETAITMGLVGRSDFGGIDCTANGNSNLDKPCTREEMAYILANALKYTGETPEQLASYSTIPDMNKASEAYKDGIITAYSLGLISGYDSKHTFGPKDTMTRGQAAAVMVRLVDKADRAKVEFNDIISGEHASQGPVGGLLNYTMDENSHHFVAPGQTNTPQTWKEGEAHSTPKAGDTIIANDGKKYVLQETDLGGGCVILGLGVPANIWDGCNNGSYTISCKDTPSQKNAGGFWDKTDKTGFTYGGVTGAECHTHAEWSTISLAVINGKLPQYAEPTRQGKAGETANTYYVWNDIFGEWVGTFGGYNK